ncbi:MAG: phytoene desaturase [Deltaproteobacteria bacterium]|nr:phytoene desaturase [Deltaproteobacteria bacterium]MBI3293926.1 phytoene desaturase [Deltaproteobacteria bacterium]
MDKTAAIVGSGFGGLAAAIRLQASGVDTTIYEKRERPGGRAYVYEDQGYRFDAGPTVITAPEALYELFDLAGRKLSDYVELVPVDPFYRLHFHDGGHFDYGNDEPSMLQQIDFRNPRDVKGYQEFLKYSKAVYDEGYSRLVHVPFQSFWDMIRVSPQLLRLKAYRSVYSTVSCFITDENLRQAFSFHSLLIGGNPFSASSIYTLIHYLERNGGVWFPRGGTGALVQALVKLFTDLGGRIHLSTPVKRIVTDNNKVLGVATERLGFERYSWVVSNGEGLHTYRDLLKDCDVAKKRAAKLDRKRYSMSLFLIYFGVNRTFPLPHHNVIFGPRYRELLGDIFERGVLADDFSLYLHNPSATDSSLAPPGCSSFYVLSPVPHLGKFAGDWSKIGPEYADRILKFLEKRLMPDLTRSIVSKRIFTPMDFQTELNAHMGSAFSLEPTLLQSAYFRMPNVDPKIQGLYFVGAGTHPGAGVPGVINSAKATCSLMLPSAEGTDYLLRNVLERKSVPFGEGV